MKNKQPSTWQQTILPLFSLFTSVGTLLCCALPALLVTIGMGAAVAGLIGTAPWITAVSDYKEALFAVGAVLIIVSAYLQWQARLAPCPADPLKAKACNRLRKISWIILGIAALLYVVGFFFAFIAIHIFF